LVGNPHWSGDSQSADDLHAPPWGVVPRAFVTSEELSFEEQAAIRDTQAASMAVTSEVFIAAEPTQLGQRCRHAIDTDVYAAQ
jgi:hypothetical protein